MHVLLLGGTGFVGQVLARQLSERGHQVTILTRHAERHRQLQLLTGVALVEVSHFTELVLRKQVRGKDAVINLIGILHENDHNAFHRTHVELVRKLIAACDVEGVDRLLHMSALGASMEAPSRYFRSKAEAEAFLLASGLRVSIFKPSIIFGQQDQFINLFRKLLARLPVMAVVCPQSILSPIWVEDVAAAFVHELHSGSVSVVELCGTRAYTMMELMGLVAEFTPRPARLLPLSDAQSRLMARVMGWLPAPMMTLDNYHSLQVPSVCQQSNSLFKATLSLRSYLMQLTGLKVRDRFMVMRQHAAR